MSIELAYRLLHVGMVHLRYSIKELEKVLDEGKTILLQADGEWSIMGLVGRIFPNYYIKRSTRSFIKFLDNCEKEPVSFPLQPGSIFKNLLSIGKKLLSKNPDAILAQRMIALQYRLEAINGGLDPDQMVESDFIHLTSLATTWKKEKKLFWDPELTPLDVIQIERTTRYRAFSRLIFENVNLREAFFEWMLRDRLPATVFIEYPALVSTINDNLLNGRIGTVGGDRLKIQKILKNHELLKVVTLPFEGREISILDRRQKIHLRGGFTLTIDEIFKLFKDKPRRFVDVEYFAHGIANWNAQHLGYCIPSQKRYKTINLEQAEWWRQLPPLEIISWEEAKGRYGSWVSGLNWIASAKASRHHLNLNYEKCHAYFEIAIPTKDGSYHIYDFGKFARMFPYGVVDNMRMFTITTPATIAYPDENIYHTTRQHVGYAFELHHYQGLILMEELRQDILRARSGNMVFQIEAENCGHWIQTHLEELLGKELVPNLFRAKLIKSDAQGFMGAFFKFVRMLPTMYHPYAMNIFHYPFGAWRGHYVMDGNGKRVFKSLNRTSFWKDIVVYMPALLHRQYERGYISPNVPFDELDEAIEKKTSFNELL